MDDPTDPSAAAGAEDNKPLFDILDPPPFAIWARGELVGIDLSAVDHDGATDSSTGLD